ncbi:MAG: hypothetical protein HY360_09865 [Verrucomicrobia bacterium]|nr:hypothetical protein [Verrucomicrobiota bacterium]
MIQQMLVYGRNKESTDSVLATFLPLGLADNLWHGWIDEQRLKQVWAIQDAFHCEEAEFVPYWDSAREVTTSPELKTLVTSVWRRNDKRLAAVCNLGEQACKTTLQPKRAVQSAVDAETHSPVLVRDGRVQIVVPEKSWKMIVLE